MLTGKNKERFIDWLHQYMMTQTYGSKFRFIEQFDALPLSMQLGVIQDYADSIGYHITFSWIGGEYGFCPDITKDDIILWEEEFKTRDEARLAAIKAFDEIVNG